MRAGRLGSAAASASGFTLVWVLAALAILSTGLAVVGPIWADQAQRERERELLRVGEMYAQAIARYRAASPGSAKQWPSSLEDLLLDSRYAGTVRHLRKLYADPMSPDQPWGLVPAQGGGIRGVYSQSADKPLRREALVLDTVVLPVVQRYDEWKFVIGSEP